MAHITTFLFAAVALYIIVYLAGSILSGFFGSTPKLKLGQRLFGWRFRRFEKALKGAEQAIEDKKISTASTLLRDAFCLESGFAFSKEFEKLNTHNFSVLSRVVSLYEDTDIHLPNLPVVEELLQSRYDLMRAYIETTQTRIRIKLKDSEKQKSSPQWAFDEIDGKLKDLSEKLDTNRLSLISQIDSLFRSLRDSTDQTNIQYH